MWLPSPLLNAELPEWMMLHFQIDPQFGWQSPQVISDELAQILRRTHADLKIPNVTPERKQLLSSLSKQFPTKEAVAICSVRGLKQADEPMFPIELEPTEPLVNPPPQPNPTDSGPQQQQIANTASSPATGNTAQQYSGRDNGNRINPNFNIQNGDPEYVIRQQLNLRGKTEGKSSIQNDVRNYPSVYFPGNNMKEILAIEPPVEIRLGSMKPIWFGKSLESPEYLLYVRVAEVGSKCVYQGIVLDWPLVRDELLASVTDLFPDAKLSPLSDGETAHPERAMSALPIELEPGAIVLPASMGWNTLRTGLVFAWVAAVIALLAVGMGGWTLLDLSERRIRFVSAVTHELRTPLTTLRLYLDLLTSGMVTDEKHRAEYLATLHTESDRLHRLIGNVLDFARLEKSRPSVQMVPLSVSDLLEQVRQTWQERCATDAKELVVENHLIPGVSLVSDSSLVQQILSNLVDNARKYTRDAEDPRIWIRAGNCDNGSIYIEVEDRGPGVEANERTSIFRPFCRGNNADVTAGGVGLGLALAKRWATLLNGRLILERGEGGIGARFRLELPV